MINARAKGNYYYDDDVVDYQYGIINFFFVV